MRDASGVARRQRPDAVAVGAVAVPEVDGERPVLAVAEARAELALRVPLLDADRAVRPLAEAPAHVAAVVEQLDAGRAVGPGAEAGSVVALGVPELDRRVAVRLRPVCEYGAMAAVRVPDGESARQPITLHHADP